MEERERDDQTGFDTRDKVVKKKVVYPIPAFDVQIGASAEVVSRLLIEYPESLTQFRVDISDKLFLASVDEDVNTQERLRKYLKTINKKISDPETWTDADQTPLTVDQSSSLLSNLPNLEERNELVKQTDQKLLIDLTESLTNGLISKRFESGGDWRAAFNNFYSIFQAAAFSKDPQTIHKFFNILLGDYKEVMPQDSLSWRSVMTAKATFAPSDEEILRKYSELDKSIVLISEITGQKEDRKRLAQDNAVRMLQISAARTVFFLGLDPSSGEGRKQYKVIIEGRIKDDVGKYRHININKLKLKRLAPDQLEVAQLLAKNYDREVLWNQYAGTFDDSGKIFSTRELPSDPEVLNQFPFNIILYDSEERKALRSIVKKAIVKKQMFETAEQFAAQDHGEKWNIIPFAQDNLHGYLIINPKYNSQLQEMSAKERVLYIQSLIENNNLHEYWDEMRSKGIVGAERSVARGDKENYIFILAKEEFTIKNQLETSLDLTVPDELRRKALEILSNLIKQRYKIPRNFTKLPTIAGDSYQIENHLQLPGVFESAVIRKYEKGGIHFGLKIAKTDDSTVEDQYINGVISFPQDRLTIHFQGNAENLSDDLKWIVESVVLSLTERSCCRPLSEEERLKRISEGETAEDLKEETSSGGFVVHVGGFRKSGARKEFTSYAANNFETAMDEIGRDTGGLSLVFINEQHKIKVPTCDRYLTWNKGWEKPDSKPIQRKAPEKLLILEN